MQVDLVDFFLLRYYQGNIIFYVTCTNENALSYIYTAEVSFYECFKVTSFFPDYVLNDLCEYTCTEINYCDRYIIVFLFILPVRP